MSDESLTIGEVARRAGVTVRALRHWESLGLLRTLRASSSNHRRYGRAELERLHTIVALRQLDFSLSDIAKVLSKGTPLSVIVRARLDAAVEAERSARRLRLALERVWTRLEAGEVLSIEALFHTMEAMTMHEKHFTPEQLNQLRERHRELGADAVKQNEREWKQLVLELRTAHSRGELPESPVLQALAERSERLLAFLTGGDTGLEAGFASLYRGDTESVLQALGPPADRAPFSLLGRARALRRAQREGATQGTMKA